MALIETITLQFIDYQKSLLSHYKKDKYVKTLVKFNNIFQNC